MSVICAPLTAQGMTEVLHKVRPRDAAEIEVVFPGTIWEWGEAVLQVPGDQWAICHNGEPVAACGLNRPYPHVANTWLLTTPLVHRCPKGVLRLIRALHQELVEDGVVRFQTINVADRDSEPGGYIHRWLTCVGYHEEARHPRLGIQGQTMITFARLEA